MLAHPVLVAAVARLPIHHDPRAWQVSPGLLILANQRLVKDAGRTNVANIQAELIAEDSGDMPPRRERSFVEKLDTPVAISISDSEIHHDARLGGRPHRGGVRIILEGPNLVEKRQAPECLHIGGIEHDSNLGPDLLQQAKRWRANQRVAD